MNIDLPGLPIPSPSPGNALLEDKIAVVTAAAGSGIGGAVARRFLLEGARVMISDRHEPRLAETLATLEAEFGSSVVSHPCDVTSTDEVEALYDETERRLGPVDIGFNNAGLGGSTPILEMGDDDWLRVIDVTLNSAFRCTRSLLRRMVERGSGVIVNNASVSGWRAEAGLSHYAAAKAGVMALTRCAAAEGAPLGVRVNAIAPTITAHENLFRAVGADVVAEQGALQIQGRPAETHEMASVVAFLASDLSSYLTGEVLSVSSQHP